MWLVGNVTLSVANQLALFPMAGWEGCHTEK